MWNYLITMTALNKTLSSFLGMLRTLIYLTTYALSLLHAKAVTNHPPTNTLPVTTRQGCEHEGQFYSPGERFDEGNNGQGWCYGLYCDHDGFVVAWDNFNCGTSTSSMPDTISRLTTPKTTTPKTTTPKTTTPEPTTPKSTTPLTTLSPPTTTPRPLHGCEYEGQFYSPGEKFGEGNDGQGWCYGSYCTEDGYIVVWDNFNCHSTSSMPDTTTYFTTRKITTPSNTTSKNTILPTTLLLSTVFSFFMALTSAYWNVCDWHWWKGAPPPLWRICCILSIRWAWIHPWKKLFHSSLKCIRCSKYGWVYCIINY